MQRHPGFKALPMAAPQLTQMSPQLHHFMERFPQLQGFQGQGGGGQNGIGAAGQAGGQMGSAGADSLAGMAGRGALSGLIGLGPSGAFGPAGFAMGLLGTAAQNGMLGPAFGPASLHNADINPAAYNIDASGYSPADFGGSAGGYGQGATDAGGGYGSDQGGHAGQGSAQGGFNKGGIVPGRGSHDTYRAKLTPGEAVLTKGATKMLHPHVVMMLNALAAAHGRK